MTPRIGIVVPMFNEIDRLNPDYFLDLVSRSGIRLVFVDDGSTDDTASFVNSFITGSENMTMLSLKENLGKANAVRLGWQYLDKTFSPDFLGFLDADGAFSHNDIERLVNWALNSHKEPHYIPPPWRTCSYLMLFGQAEYA